MTIIYKALDQALGVFGKWNRYGFSLHKASIIYKKIKFVIATIY